MNKECLLPGSITTTQIGNSTDTLWTPGAPTVIIATEATIKEIQYIGIAKRVNGELDILLHIMRRPEDVSADDRGLGECYSAASLNFTNGQYKNYLSNDQINLIHAGMKLYKKKIDKLDAYKELKKPRAKRIH